MYQRLKQKSLFPFKFQCLVGTFMRISWVTYVFGHLQLVLPKVLHGLTLGKKGFLQRHNFSWGTERETQNIIIMIMIMIVNEFHIM